MIYKIFVATLFVTSCSQTAKCEIREQGGKEYAHSQLMAAIFFITPSIVHHLRCVPCSLCAYTVPCAALIS